MKMENKLAGLGRVNVGDVLYIMSVFIVPYYKYSADWHVQCTLSSI